MKRKTNLVFRYLPAALVAVVFVWAAVIVSNYKVKSLDLRLRQEMHDELIDFVDAIDHDLHSNLSFTSSDQFHPVYQRINRQLIAFVNYFPDARVYSLRPKDGKLVYGMSSKIMEETLPGKPFLYPESETEKLVHLKSPVTIGPVNVEGKQMMSAFFPVNDPRTGKVQYIIGMDFPAGKYIIALNSQKKASVWFVAIALVLVLGFFLGVSLRDRLSPDKALKYRHFETITVSLLGVIITLVAILIVRNLNGVERQKYFDLQAAQQAATIRLEFNKIRENLRTTSNFFISSNEVDKTEFKLYTEEVLRNSSIVALAWLKPEEQASKTEKNQISELASPVELPLGKQTLVFKYLESNVDPGLAKNFRPEMFNLVDKDIETAFKEGMTNCTGLVYLMVNGSPTPMVLVFYPVFKTKHKKIRTLDDQEGFMGFIVAFINIQNTINISLGRLQWLGELTTLGIVDLMPGSSKELIAAYPQSHLIHIEKGPFLEHLGKFPYKKILPFFMWGRSFALMAHSKTTNLEQFRILNTVTVGIIGFVLTIMITFIMWLLKNRWLVLEQIVWQRTAKLSERINDLTCLKQVNEALQVATDIDLMIDQLPAIISSGIHESQKVELLLYSGRSIQKQQPDKEAYHVDIIAMGESVGLIRVIKATTFIQEEEIQLLNQIALILGRWIERYRIKEALRLSEEKFRNLIENAFDAIYLKENERYTYVNKSFIELSGFLPGELMAEDFDQERLHTSYSVEVDRARAEALVKGEVPSPRFETQIRTKTLQIRDIEISTVSFAAFPDTIVMGIIHDITERKLADIALKNSEEALQIQNEELMDLNLELLESNNKIKSMNEALVRAKDMAEESDKLKTAFLSNISHELRTPLNGIIGATNLITDPTLPNENKREVEAIIERSTARLIRTITAYMDISMLNSGTMPLIITNQYVSEGGMQYVIDEAAKACDLKGLEFEVHIPAECTKLVLSTDHGLLVKMLEHLLENAVKFTDRGKITFSYSLQNGLFQMEVSDTGIGIDKDSHAKIFEVFMQEDQSHIRRFDGNGLGLSICNKICQLLNGNIFFESEKEKGSKFTLTLPVSQTKQAREKESDGGDQFVSELENPLVLVAEDEDSNFKVIEMLLKNKINARVIRARDGHDAVEKCKENPGLKMVFMDIKMPLMDGFEATRLIKSLFPDIPVIAMTAYGNHGDEQLILDAGCDAYLAKPFKLNDVLRKINKFIILKS
ncbi:MAG: response regulator [Bacteroidetes bacterium]|nr:response regulator [Bacteroidota bacterium]